MNLTKEQYIYFLNKLMNDVVEIEDVHDLRNELNNVLKFEVKVDDTTVFGTPGHDHNMHRVYVRDLSYEEAMTLKSVFEKAILNSDLIKK